MGDQAANGPRAHLRDWWQNIALRTKVTGVTFLIMTLGLAASGFGVTEALRGYLLADANQQVLQTMESVTTATIAVDESAVHTQYVFAHFDSDGSLIQANPGWRNARILLGAQDLTGQPARDSVRMATVIDGTGQAGFRIATKRLSDNTVVAAGLPLAGIERLIGQLSTLFVLFSLCAIVLGTALTRLLVSTAFKPLRKVEVTAAAIANGDFSQRLDGDLPNTEVGRLNRSLNQMLNRIDMALADRAQTIGQMRRFVGDASHELRTPLVSVRGYAELYRMGALQTPEDVTQAMGRIEKEAVRLGSLVSDLLTLARLDESRELKLAPVELLPLAHDAALDARALAPNREIRVLSQAAFSSKLRPIEVLAPVGGETEEEAAVTTLTMRLFRRARKVGQEEEVSRQAGLLEQQSSPTTMAMTLGEEDKLRQVLANLIGNAIRYTPDATPIEIAAYHEGEQAVLEVIDHGEGIAPQVRDKIFGRFWRADSSRTRDTGGSGLGLSIVAAIVAAHGGKIDILETAGGGATFRVALPLWRDDAGRD